MMRSTCAIFGSMVTPMCSGMKAPRALSGSNAYAKHAHAIHVNFLSALLDSESLTLGEKFRLQTRPALHVGKVRGGCRSIAAVNRLRRTDLHLTLRRFRLYQRHNDRRTVSTATVLSRTFVLTASRVIK
ncbi:hypothetical protein KIN20_007321 [Parelaphostrongylus tenuis]|uniref:Uncharacterized protein n=1 Tax=Parelaphostrongylus tenuis TaxID=148309 RepID=A0AAD5M5A8_PARTN|nr:hypothetical protein KIN20_007321 [Parelaphostrongylus tenuis]